jgi:hypothetical protein
MGEASVAYDVCPILHISRCEVLMASGEGDGFITVIVVVVVILKRVFVD